MNGGARIVAVMVLVAMACGLSIAGVYEGTAARIADNRTRLLETAVGQVLPGTVEQRTWTSLEDAALAGAVAGYDRAGNLIGLALPMTVMGYQDRLRLLFGYDPKAERIVGLAVLESRETPGLGAKIGTETRFLSAFADLDVELDADKLINEVRLTPRGASRQPWEVDGITGATVSSRAVVRAANELVPAFVAAQRHLGGAEDG